MYIKYGFSVAMFANTSLSTITNVTIKRIKLTYVVLSVKNYIAPPDDHKLSYFQNGDYYADKVCIMKWPDGAHAKLKSIRWDVEISSNV